MGGPTTPPVNPTTRPPPPRGPAQAVGSGGGTAPAPGFTVQEFNGVVRNLDPGLLFEGDGATRKLAVGTYAPEGWLLYFWFEAKGSFAQHASFEQAKKVRAFFDKAFEKAPDFATSKKIYPKGKLLDLFSAAELHDHLSNMLKIGFASIDLGTDDTSDDMNRFKLMVGKKLKAQVFWRSEGRRGFEQLREKGYTKQAHDVNVPPGGDPCRRQAINCDQPWHPFSKPEVSKKLWYRRANSDNCWYTAVSIASQWQTSVCYPKIDQTPDLQFLRGTPTIDPAFLARHKAHYGEVEYTDGSVARKIVSRSKVAMLIVDDVVFDTQAKQDADGRGGYDEKAVSCIAGRNVVGMVQFWRIFHGADDSDGVTVLVDKAACERADNTLANLTRIFGDYLSALAFKEQLERAYNGAYQSPPLALRWDPSGWASMPSLPKTVKRIRLDGKVVWTA